MTKNILIIPDAHANPRVSQRRFHWLGKLIADLKPDYVVDLGDWADNDSLSGYDRGKASFEGRRYAKDVACAHEARDIVDRSIQHMARKPKLWAICGNHCGRSDRYAEEHPEMQGKISSLDFKPVRWEWVPFLTELKLCGISFSHYYPSGLMGRPIGGQNPAFSLLRDQLRSCVQGHNHLWNFCERTSGARKIQCLTAGAYTEPTWNPAYAGPSRRLWWDGITYLEDVKDGWASSIQRIHISRLMREYK